MTLASDSFVSTPRLSKRQRRELVAVRAGRSLPIERSSDTLSSSYASATERVARREPGPAANKRDARLMYMRRLQNVASFRARSADLSKPANIRRWLRKDALNLLIDLRQSRVSVMPSEAGDELIEADFEFGSMDALRAFASDARSAFPPSSGVDVIRISALSLHNASCDDDPRSIPTRDILALNALYGLTPRPDGSTWSLPLSRFVRVSITARDGSDAADLMDAARRLARRHDRVQVTYL